MVLRCSSPEHAWTVSGRVNRATWRLEEVATGEWFGLNATRVRPADGHPLPEDVGNWPPEVETRSAVRLEPR